MSQRPLILSSSILRTICPPKPRCKHYTTTPSPSPTGRSWSHPPTSADVADDQVARLAATPLHPLSLADLVRHGRPPLSADALFSSANFTLSLLPNRLAHRIQALRNLPFIVVSNPHVSKIYNNYLHSLSTLLPYQERQITSLEDETQFTEVMADLVQTHSNTIPILARGFLECRKYISPADQSNTSPYTSPPSPTTAASPPPSTSPPSYIGVIDTALLPASTIRHCESFVSEICELKYGVRPTLTIDGDPSTRLAHVPTHLEYILTELLKNAFRATVESGHERFPIEVTIAATSHAPPGPASAPGVAIRIRDRGGGIAPENLNNIWSYSFTTFGDEDVADVAGNGVVDALNAIAGAGVGGSSLAGLGYGLPLGRAYAEYFGGGIEVQRDLVPFWGVGGRTWFSGLGKGEWGVEGGDDEGDDGGGGGGGTNDDDDDDDEDWGLREEIWE
ncbi:MAG: ase propeptide [Lasallia pustulata]|uniref:Protein-serine/threonine kinase n=1 Tax=Lasallia pustulata TaxID=136370 RepID=A0A5M8PJV1_9LECA|nr:MAG: ase propeptide [Lasallia pustulata]